MGALLKKLLLSMLSVKNSLPFPLSTPDIPQLVQDYATKYQLRVDIVAALIYQESAGGEIWAYRFEEAFYHRYIENKTRDTLIGYVPPANKTPNLISEKRARSASWGLMQIMGQTARENGFNGRWLPALYDPTINLDTGCAFLRKLLDNYSDLDEETAYRKALLRYNGGGEPKYPDIVFQHIESGAYKKILGEIT